MSDERSTVRLTRTSLHYWSALIVWDGFQKQRTLTEVNNTAIQAPYSQHGRVPSSIDFHPHFGKKTNRCQKAVGTSSVCALQLQIAMELDERLKRTPLLGGCVAECGGPHPEPSNTSSSLTGTQNNPFLAYRIREVVQSRRFTIHFESCPASSFDV